MLKKELGEIKGLEIIGGLITSRIEDKKGIEGRSIKVLVPKAINHGIVEQGLLGNLDIKTDPDEKKLTHEGDLVIKLSTPYDVCLIDKENEGLLVPSFCAIIRGLSEEIDNKYLLSFLNSDYCLSQIKTSLIGTTIPIMSIRILKELNVIIPNHSKQIKIADDYYLALKKEKLLNDIIRLEYEKLNSEIYELLEENND